jgi:hypothetical protein
MLNSPKKIPGDFPRESSYILAEATKNYKGLSPSARATQDFPNFSTCGGY